jgi:thiol-disulfide isomerase/thioredoxin
MNGWRGWLGLWASILILGGMVTTSGCGQGAVNDNELGVPVAANGESGREPVADQESVRDPAVDGEFAGEPAADREAVSEPVADREEIVEPVAIREDEGGESEVGEEDELAEQTPEAEAVEPRENPFARRLDMPEFPEGMEWLNTKPLKLSDLHGKFVILDFWTYCCINCIHILPELKKLEQAYPNNLVVIGVHSAKFETEKDTENIAAAILRYEIEHPVVNDHAHVYWNTLGVRSWPTIVLIDPEGKFVGAQPGEFQFEDIDRVLKGAIPYYREQGLLDETPLHFDLLAFDQEPTPLRFPGKILADEEGGRLFITDSNHNRIVITSLSGEVLTIIGSGQMGREDGNFAESTFDHPQGLALHGDTLYVADTENHLLRKVDLAQETVTTIAGTGRQGRVPFPGMERLREGAPLPDRFVGPPDTTALNSPWALWVHDDALYIAMAGPHQIWKMPLDESEIGPYAGNGREDIVDGPLLPAEPFALGASSFAQPSGLSSDGTWLYVADSEGSSIRAVPFDPKESVRTVVGTAHLPHGRLFQFGDVDGEGEEVRLQHALEVVYHDGKLYVADTYNHKIKVVDAESGSTTTLAGTGESGSSDDPAQFFEPAGLAMAHGKLYVADTNNHLIRTIDLESGQVGTMAFEGLTPPRRPESPKPDFSGTTPHRLERQTVQATEGAVTLAVRIELPEGWKMNSLASQHYWLEAEDQSGPVHREQLGRKEVTPPTTDFTISLPVRGEGRDQLTLSSIYYYCQDDDGICKVGSVVWEIPLEVVEGEGASEVRLSHEVKE